MTLPSAVDKVNLSLQQPHKPGRESSEQPQLWDENPELRAVMRPAQVMSLEVEDSKFMIYSHVGLAYRPTGGVGVGED